MRNKKLFMAGLVVLIFIYIAFVGTGCIFTEPFPTEPIPITPIVTQEPQPTPTCCVVEPTPAPFPDYEWWLDSTTDWPTVIDGLKLCYVVVDKDTFLLTQKGTNKAGKPIFDISQAKEFGGTPVYQRTQAKEGKILMAWAGGDTWGSTDAIENDSPFCRPFEGDGGVQVYWLMFEQIVDGKELWNHPHRPLFVKVDAINREILP